MTDTARPWFLGHDAKPPQRLGAQRFGLSDACWRELAQGDWPTQPPLLWAALVSASLSRRSSMRSIARMLTDPSRGGRALEVPKLPKALNKP